GDAVQRGQTLIVLDAPEITADFAEASADAQVAEAKYRGSLDAYNRILNADKVPGTVAPGEKESSKSRMQSDSSAWEAAKSKLNAYEQLKDYLTIRAPFSGLVTERNADPGTLVSSAHSQPLMVVENNSKLRLRIPVPEAYTAAAPKDGKVGFTVDAYPGVQFEAALSRKAGAINLQNRTEAWEFLYENNDKKLKSGMFANCTVSFQRSAPSFVVPVTAIVTTQEKRFVIRLSDGQAEWVDVRTGITLSDAIEIFGNLSEGDILVQRGNDEIQPGKRLVAK
ncbi:MAG: efflux RND transporter periplasmic adaptor subunit, partial [Tannerella sp.]|nr:efflux RND transporter periplasmic adaptor subunit [Tannerella sp.]